MDMQPELVHDALNTLATAAALAPGQGAAGGIHDSMIDPVLQNAAFTGYEPSLAQYNPALLGLLPQEQLAFTTPVQQTRSGRISRPPVLDAQQAFFANLQQQQSQPDPLTAAGIGGTTLDVIAAAVKHFLQQSQQPLSAPYDLSIDAGAHSEGGTATPRPRGDTSTPVPRARGAKGKGKRRAPTDDEDESDDDRARAKAGGSDVPGLPEWPLPPRGPKSRKNMPREEMLARRRARNRVAAVESRKKRKDMMSETETKLQEGERRYMELWMRYQALEAEVIGLRAALGTSAIDSQQIHPQPQPQAGISFNALFSDDENDEDPEFIPSSPQNFAEGSDSDDDENEDEDDENEDEDEDLFLPIQDVPIPSPPAPLAAMQEIQRVLGPHDSAANGSNQHVVDALKMLGDMARKQGLLN